ncbi:Cyclin [Gracilaria domingensis]|nr:Cyclin [Gracilaria domingensis]
MSKPRSILHRTIDEEYAFRMMLNCSSGQYSEQLELLQRLNSPAHKIYAARRPVLIEWLADICLHFGIRSLTLHIAIRLMDVFVFSIPWSSSLSPLCALTCLYTASKYDKTDDIPSISEWERVGEAGCSAENIRSMEVILLSALQWNLGYKTPVHYLLEYVSVLHRLLAVGNDDGHNSSDIRELSDIWDHEPFLNSSLDAYEESDGDISDLSEEDCEREGNQAELSYDITSPDSVSFIETACTEVPKNSYCSQSKYQNENSSHSDLFQSYRIAADLLDISLLHPLVYLSHAPQTLAASALLIGFQITGGSVLPVDARALCAGNDQDVESSTSALMGIMNSLSVGNDEDHENQGSS